ncbi:hypothetical protein [Phaeobacter sp. HF9A]|uniref:hypothetical protein n=1 Tax=Phaeobacter sp. HF9A TaxID=2721561 RepID=UPI001432222C|nr:hypothetical protein [Phaeobacter sp. HF9A]NIZ14720.1 hypothetical protein [Phaeobacter sp. HF9A]
MAVEKQKRTLVSKSYGTLDKADAFVYRDFEPADEATRETITKLANDLGLPLRGKSQSQKYIRCLSDFLVASRASEESLIAWPAGAGEYNGPPYGLSVAKVTREALLGKGMITLHQKASKRDGLARVFRVNRNKLPASGRFKAHGEGPLVIVKSKKVMVNGKNSGGTPMGRKQFEPKIKVLEEQVKSFNKIMTSKPLESPKGITFGRCYRVFNNGSLQSGGRLYGPWQTLPEAKRLQLTIEGEPVCEIDLKASFLSISNGLTGFGDVLPFDPYQKIRFVQEANGTDNQRLHRDAAKLLVNAYLCKDGDFKKFPKSKTKDKVSGKVIPFKKLHQLEMSFDYYLAQIHAAFPFLRAAKSKQFNLMFEESKIIIEAIEIMQAQGVVSWPVHDSLLVKKSDREKAEAALRKAVTSLIGREVSMDCSFLDENGEVITEVIQTKCPTATDSHNETIAALESFSLGEAA